MFLILEDADSKTFKALGCYGKDKSHIYDSRHEIINTDYATFRVKDAYDGCYAKDKNGYFFWNERIPIEEVPIEVKKTFKER